MKSWGVVALLFLLFSFDIGNINAPRQGTEGFYLKVSQETYQSGNALTPIYLGAPHWSKPPLLFVLGFPAYFITNRASLSAARISILIFSFILIFHLAKVFSRTISRDERWLEIFLLLVSSLSFIKYSRIYMNEILLFSLPAISCLYAFNYFFKQSQRRDLILAIIFSFIGTLSKGPVSLVGQLIPLFIYCLLTERKKIFTIILRFALPCSALSCLWFIYEYSLFGQDFLNYSFLRENLGKFTSKPYPIYVVCVGLLLFSLPWTLSIVRAKFFIQSIRADRGIALYLAINVLSLLLLWTIPSQRSHHYAIPACSFFIMLIYLIYKNDQYKLQFMRYFNIGFCLTFTALTLLLFSLGLMNGVFIFISFVCILLAIIVDYKIKQPIYRIAIPQILYLSMIWTTIGPAVYLPLVPEHVVEILSSQKNVHAVFRKPYFLSEILNKEVIPVDESDLQKVITESANRMIVTQSSLQILKQELYEIESSWPIWRRGVKISEIINALRNSEFISLQEKLALIKPRTPH